MTAVTPDAAVDLAQAKADDTAFFGHPRALLWLISVEGCSAFAFYGLQTLLTLYMTQQLLTPGHIEHVIGFPAFRAGMEAIYGRMTPLGLASETFGMVMGLAFAAPILGALLADRWIGQTRAVAIGMAVCAIGGLLLTSEAGFLLGLAFIIVGTGLVKCNLMVQVGALYGQGDPRRTRAFALYLIAANIGSMLQPLIAGSLAERVGFRYGFMALAAGLVLGLGAYAVGRKHLPRDTLRLGKDGHHHAPKLQRGDGRIIVALIFALVPEVLYFGTYNQAFNIFPVWAKASMNLNIAGFEMPVTWFSTLDGILTIVGAVAAIRFWSWQTSRGKDMGDLTRMAIGCAMGVGGFLILAAAALIPGKAPILAGVGFFVLVDPAITWVDTVTMSLISRTAPRAVNTTMMGVFGLSTAAANFLVGYLGHYFELISPARFWLLHAGMVGAAVVFLALFGPAISRSLTPQTL
jgi:POT family proton-dependent oligopeptide transporter